jgi:4-amino-4-deoxy-L-arabinose transferase-like glycosyltransferase
MPTLKKVFMLRRENKLLLLILFLAFVLRFYQISSQPPGLYWDEASIGYNAYSILKTGRDESGEFLPLAFKAFGEYKQPLYIYLTAASMAVFGLNEFAVRFPSAFFGTLTVLLVYFLAKKLSQGSVFSSQFSVLSTFFLAISPWHLQFSRAGFEANLALFWLVLGSLLFLQRRLFWSCLSFLLAMLTYGTAKIFIPPFLLVLIFLYRKEKFFPKPLNLILLLLLIFFPFLITFFLPQSLSRFYMVSALAGKELVSYPLILLKNYLAHFSFEFLFFQGDQIPRHGVGEMGNLYFFEIPLILVGFWQLLKLKAKKAKIFLLTWLLMAPVASAVSQPSPHSLRSLNMVVPLVLISALGFWHLMRVVSQKGRAYFLGFSFLASAVIFYFFVSYCHLYWVHYPQKATLDWQQGNKEMVLAVLKREKDYEKVAISSFFGHPYLYLLFYGKIEPSYFLKEKTPEGFGKYLFVADEWEKKTDEKVLFVSSYKIEEGKKLLDEVRLKNGDVVYRLWEL